MDDLLQQGITTYKAGKRNEARDFFIAAVRQNPNSEPAWGWMSNVCNNDQERIHCLRQVLRINPKNEKVQQRLDQLLAPVPSDLPLSPVPSAPALPISSGVKARAKNSAFTQAQLFILAGLTVMVIFIFGFVLLFMFGKKDSVVIPPSTTTFAASSASNTPFPTQALPTATLIPTYAYAATWTPLPSPTSFVITPLKPPTAIPQQAQSNPAVANPPAASSSSNCSAQLDYAAAMHKYYLDQIDYIHAPLINLYQSWIDEAARNRDAGGMVDAQQRLENEKAQVKAEKASENKRYKAEVASINASCQ